MNESRNWVVVAARDHALFGVEQGIIQANHGKSGPLRRMNPGDGIVLYAPKLVYGASKPCQRFVALGQVSDSEVYQVSASDNFHPFRRRVSYQMVIEIPIQPLLSELTFIGNQKQWGYWFRFGCFAIPQSDFEKIRFLMTKVTNEP